MGLDWIGLDKLNWIGVDRIGKLVHLTKAVLVFKDTCSFSNKRLSTSGIGSYRLVIIPCKSLWRCFVGKNTSR